MSGIKYVSTDRIRKLIEAIEAAEKGMRAVVDLLNRAKPIVENYAASNPRYRSEFVGRGPKDPMGAHRWLEDYAEAMREEE